MLDSAPLKMLWEWMAFNALDPIGEERADYRSGQIAALIAGQWGKKQFTPYDFMPWSEKPRQSPTAMYRIAKMFATAKNVKERHGRKR